MEICLIDKIVKRSVLTFRVEEFYGRHMVLDILRRIVFCLVVGALFSVSTIHVMPRANAAEAGMNMPCCPGAKAVLSHKVPCHKIIPNCMTDVGCAASVMSLPSVFHSLVERKLDWSSLRYDSRVNVIEGRSTEPDLDPPKHLS